MRGSIAFLTVLAVLAGGTASLIVGCSRSGPSTSLTSKQGPINPWSGHEAVAKYAAQHGKTVYQVTYQPETVFFDLPSTERALQGISADGVTFRLDASVPAATQLKAGSVLFLYGVAIRKVTAVHVEGSIIVATTSEGDITDAIRDGHIEWEMPVDYSIVGQPSTSARSRPFEDFFVAPALALAAKSPLSPWTQKFGGTADQFKYELGFGYEANRLNIDIHGIYTGDGALIDVHGKGYVQPVLSTGSIDISGGLIDKFKVALKRMSGHVDFDWKSIRKDNGALSALDRNFKIKFPGSFQWPFLVGPIPLVFDVSAAIIVHPAFTSKNAGANGHFTVDYSGSSGFTTGSSPPQPDGEMHGDTAIGHETSVSSMAAMGMTAALELPRFEISLAILPPQMTELSNNLRFQKIAGPIYGKKFWKDEIKEITDGLFSFPVKPYAFGNVVTSTGIFTNGMLTSSLVALPRCERAQITLTANGGAGVKMNFKNFGKIFSTLQSSTGPKLEWSFAPPSFTYTFKAWKDHIKCPDDQ